MDPVSLDLQQGPETENTEKLCKFKSGTGKSQRQHSAQFSYFAKKVQTVLKRNTATTLLKVSLPRRLDKKWGGNLFYTKRVYWLEVFHFLFYPWSSIPQGIYFYIVFGVLFLNWFSARVIRLRLQAVRMYKDTKICDEYGASFQSSPKINRMLITRLICIRWKTSKPQQWSFAVFFFFRPLKCSVVPEWSTLSSDRIRGPTPSGKALNLINEFLKEWLLHMKWPQHNQKGNHKKSIWLTGQLMHEKCV